jgi:hypothetical protein
VTGVRYVTLHARKRLEERGISEEEPSSWSSLPSSPTDAPPPRRDHAPPPDQRVRRVRRRRRRCPAGDRMEVPSSVTRLRRERLARGLRLAELSWLVQHRTGTYISAATLSRLERNLIDSRPAVRAAIARALELSAEELWEAPAA